MIFFLVLHDQTWHRIEPIGQSDRNAAAVFITIMHCICKMHVERNLALAGLDRNEWHALMLGGTIYRVDKALGINVNPRSPINFLPPFNDRVTTPPFPGRQGRPLRILSTGQRRNSTTMQCNNTNLLGERKSKKVPQHCILFMMSSIRQKCFEEEVEMSFLQEVVDDEVQQLVA